MPLATGKNPISLILTVEKSSSLRVKMTEFYFLPYKAAEIYGKETENPHFGRSGCPISTGLYAILLILAVDAVVAVLPKAEQ